MKVYLISDYDEYGSTNVRATLDKDKVRGLVPQDWIDRFEIKEEVEQALKRLLDADVPVDGENLSHGWGGFKLHIVELE